MLQPEVIPQVHSTFEHIIFYSLQFGFAGALAKLIWGASKLSTTVDLIKDNHLVHLDAKIDGVIDDVKDVRNQLFAHIQSGAK